MTTLDLVDHFGGKPANFLDVGGGAKAQRIANALDMVFSDENVDSVVFNIFGGITRGDEVAKGINQALEQFDEIPKPVVVRLAGTNAKEGNGDSERGPGHGRTDAGGRRPALCRVRTGGITMSVLVDEDTRVVVQGITGGEGKFHAEQMIEYGTNVVAGAVPGKGGQEVAGVPVYDTVTKAAREEDANASVVFVPPAFAGDALFEALDAPLDLVVAITEGIPTQDMARVKRKQDETDVHLVGPNCPGVITPDVAKLGILPGNIFSSGDVGPASRSGTLTYQVVDSPHPARHRPDHRHRHRRRPHHRDVLRRRPRTVRGRPGHQGSRHVRRNRRRGRRAGRPLHRRIHGHPGRRLHRRPHPPRRRASAWATPAPSSPRSGTGTAESKINALENNGVPVGDTPEEVADNVEDPL